MPGRIELVILTLPIYPFSLLPLSFLSPFSYEPARI